MATVGVKRLNSFAALWLLAVSYLTPPLRRNPLEFLDETYPAKTTGIELPYGEYFIIL